MFNAVNILEALKNYIRTRGGQSAANNIAEAVNDLNSIPQGSGGDIPDEVTNAIETHGMGWTSEEEVEGFDIQWDGDTEGHEGIPALVGGFYKVSDVLDIMNPIDNLIGANYIVFTPGGPVEGIVTAEDIQTDDGKVFTLLALDDSLIIIALEDGHSGELDVSKGVWFANVPNYYGYVSRLYKEVSTEEVVHQIDQKYISSSPEVTNAIETHGMGWTDEAEVPAINIEWDGNTEGLERSVGGARVKISDLDIPNDQIIGLKYDGSYSDTHEFYTTYEMTPEEFEQLKAMGLINDDYAYIDYLIIVHKDGIVIESAEYPHKGVYVADPEYVELYISRIYKESSTAEVVHQIDQKYIPQSSGGGMVVNFTPQMVDDTITLSADKTPAEVKTAMLSGAVVGTILFPYQTEISPLGPAALTTTGLIGFGIYGINPQTLTMMYLITCDESFTEWIMYQS